MLFENIRQDVIDGSLECIRKGLIHQTSGNISLADRTRGVYAITPSGIPYRDLTPSDIPVLSLDDGCVIEGGKTPSKENPMHFAVLKRKSAVCSVVHTHSLYATAMSVILEDELPAVTVGAALYAPTRIAPYAIPGSEEIAQEALKAMGDDNIACLLKFHGQLTAGASMRDAISAAEYIEENAQTAYLLYAVHRFTPLPYEDYKFLHDRAVKKASAGASPTPVLP